ncbi:MAG: UDP-N-acetylmuramate--L-alanine ligase [Candidatus Doudnabacteria bacterium]|nr:UDP-N-acetylmuramate--L-alanine ligase [Candidatus Doudnabacteria bacterium]
MLNQVDRIHFIGIGGIGVSALARLCLAMGKKVTGSDLHDSQTVSDLKALGAVIWIGHDAANIRNPEAVVYSEDITEQSLGFVELKTSLEKKIPILTYAKALGQMMKGRFGIAVTGTNGKSTTAAMLGLILEAANFDPSIVVGTKISSENESEKFMSNARLGGGKIFVAEADEYHRHMMEIAPSMIILTNIAEDHLDYYKDLEEIKSAFVEFIKKLPPDGVVIFNADDHNTLDIIRHCHCHKFSFGIHHYADLQALNIEVENGRQTFDLHYKDHLVGKFELHVPGKFNISNALGAVLAAVRLGADPAVIAEALKRFSGTWRRFEIVGHLGRVVVVSDYGHHPAGVAATLTAAKEFYSDKKILLVFQPHHRNRTQKLFGDFVEALRNADNIIIPEIFDVAGREHGEEVSSRQIVDELVKLGVRARFAKNLEETETLIKQAAPNFDLIIFMGAGDIDSLARKMVT